MAEMRFDRVFVLTLPRRQDRLDGFLALVDQKIDQGDWPFDGRPEIRYGCDGSKVRAPHWCGDNVTPGSWGCTMAYARIIEDALSCGWDSVMMFEDDACFAEDFKARVEQAWADTPDDWDVMYIGGNLRHPRAHPPMIVNDRIMRPWRMTATHGFAMRTRFMQAAYEQIFKLPINICDWRFSDVHAAGWPQPPVNCYSTIDRLVGQRANKSDITIGPPPPDCPPGYSLYNPDHPRGEYYWPNPKTIRYLPDFRHPPGPDQARARQLLEQNQDMEAIPV